MDSLLQITISRPSLIGQGQICNFEDWFMFYCFADAIFKSILLHDNWLYLTHCGLVTPYGDTSGSTLAPVMACFLMAPSHYQNQHWLKIIGIHPRTIFWKLYKIWWQKFIKNQIFKDFLHLPWDNELKWYVSSVHFSTQNVPVYMIEDSQFCLGDQFLHLSFAY